MIEVRLKPGREKPLLRGHPWVFGGAIRDLDAATPAGTLARVCSSSGDFLGVGYVNPRCTIALRICSRADVPLDEGFFAGRLMRALALREALIDHETDTYRMVNGEGDLLPGFVVDRLADVLAVQCLTAGADALRDEFVSALAAAVPTAAIVECSRGSVRKAEGLEDRQGVLRGIIPERLLVREHGVLLAAAPGGGQKTGHFCDQRENRRRLRGMAEGCRVLDAFCYSGGFSINAAAGGAAQVVALDSSRSALELVQVGAAANWLDSRIEPVRAKVAEYLRSTDASFDVVVLDPPPLVRRRSDLRQGMRAYRDLNLWAMRRVAKDGGVLMTFTCSQHVDGESFRRTIVEAGRSVGRQVQVLDVLGPGPDHPVVAAHAEGEYLRGLLVRIM